MSKNVSLIIASYNQTNALDLVLEAVLTQTYPIDELIVADDGSQPDTQELIGDFAKRAPFPVEFTTQEDAGFRKARALNNAIRKSSGRYILFLDGDCIAPPDWARHYVRALESGSDFSTAGYVLMSLDRTRAVTKEFVATRRISELIIDEELAYFKKIQRKNWFYKLIRRRHKPKMLGANWAVTRHSLFTVNGHDEKYDGFSKEDSDVRNRLWNAGFRGESLWDKNWVFHCSHDFDPRRNLPEVVRKPPNRQYFYSRKKTTTCEYGLEHLSSSE